MADFVAVIRRAVDGLTENTPEMRARVYEKAKSAVVRQLDNMNPRPPETMFKRQLDKLDDAIRQVEDEHSEALPAESEAIAAAEPVSQAVIAEPVAEKHVVEAPAHREEPVVVTAPVAERQEPVQELRHEKSDIEDTRVAPPSVWAAEAEEPRDTASLHADAHDDPVLAHAGHYEEPPLAEPEVIAPAREEFVAQQAETQVTETYQTIAPVDEEPIEALEPAAEQPDIVRPVIEQPAKAASSMPDWGVDIDREPETVVSDEQAYAEAPQMPKIAYNETDVASGFNDFLKQEFSTPAVPPPPYKKKGGGDFSWDAPFDDLPDLPKPVAFDEALQAKQKEIAEVPPKNDKRRDKNARAELEDLIGYDGEMSGARRDDNNLPPEVSRAMSKLEGKSFRVQKTKQRSFNPLPIALGVLGALVVAGGAFGFWQYREQVTTLVASYMPADTAAKTDTPAPEQKLADEATKGVQNKTADNTAKVNAEDKPTEVASLDTDMGPVKFTQRLLVDGSETETDAAKIPVDQTLTEGKTIAGQTEASKDVASTDASANTLNTDKPATDATALGVTQKMFLYEERLGGSPVAVPGTVTWSVKNDTSGTSDKPEPMIEAQLDVPERKLKALISFKRNTDASLPASHIVEIVFDLPKDFPEGNVESVQRIAFKQTEQDRGNALIAVPAKITDDFHMVALNDDADARKVNTELMKTRSWIDIPVTYRNNRRALITIEKGATGTEAFDKVLAEWSALGAQATNN